jgi:hypothetical protein
MFCLHCRETAPDGSNRSIQALGLAPGDDVALRPQRRCRRCGAVLVGPGAAMGIPGKLAQLERFGLTGRSGPVLEPRQRRKRSGSSDG